MLENMLKLAFLLQFFLHFLYQSLVDICHYTKLVAPQNKKEEKIGKVLLCIGPDDF